MRCRSQSIAARGVLLSVALVLATVAVPQGRQSRLSPWLDTAVRQARAADRLAVWVYFADKGPSTAQLSEVSNRARARRAVRGAATAATAFEDRALAPPYVQRVAALVGRVRQQSRWLNAMSVEATPAEIARPRGAELRVAGGCRAPLPARARRGRRAVARRETPAVASAGAADGPLDYGAASTRCARCACPSCTSAVCTARASSSRSSTPASRTSPTKHSRVDDHRRRARFVNGRDLGARERRRARHEHALDAGRLHAGPAGGPGLRRLRSSWPSPRTCAARRRWRRTTGPPRPSGPRRSAPTYQLLARLPRLRPPAHLLHRSRHERRDGGHARGRRRESRERGIVVVSSAGNGGFRPPPATRSARPADGVAWWRWARSRARRADAVQLGGAHGRWPHQARRGGAWATGSWWRGTSATSTAPASGTSFSCPLTAGAVALLLQAHPHLFGGRRPQRPSSYGESGQRARHAARLGHRRRGGGGRSAAADISRTAALVAKAARDRAGPPPSPLLGEPARLRGGLAASP